MTRRSSAARRRRPSFFTVLVEDDFSDQLRIPLAFYMHFDGKVPQQFLLRTPARAWNVNVKKVNDRFFFRKGWKKFVHDNGLKIGEFLVFNYAGNSKFDVQIYATNCCERGSVMGDGKSDKPFDEEGHGNGIHRKCPRSKHVGNTIRHAKHNVDDQGGSSAAGSRSTRQATSPIRKVGATDSEASESDTSMHIDEPEIDLLSEDSRIGLPSTDRPLDEEGNGNEINRKCLRSKHFGSSTRHGRKNVDNQGLKGSSADGTRTSQATSPNNNEVVIIDESEAYEASESEAYEASESEAFESETSEYEASESETSMHPLTASTGEVNALERANASNSQNPFLRVPMHPSYIHGFYVSLSSKFVKKYLIKQNSDATLRVSNGRTWPVKFQYRNANHRTTGRFMSGWKAFVRGNKLEVGDECVFNLINKTKFVLDVVIFRKREAANIAPCHKTIHGRGSTQVKKINERPMD